LRAKNNQFIIEKCQHKDYAERGYTTTNLLLSIDVKTISEIKLLNGNITSTNSTLQKTSNFPHAACEI